MSLGRILVVEDLPDVSSTICGIVRDAGYSTYPVFSREDALKVLRSEHIHVAVLDVRLDDSDEDNQDGIILMREIAEKHPAIATIILTGYANVDLVQTALQPNRHGIAPAFSFLKKSDILELPDYIQRAFKSRIKLNESLLIEDAQDCIENLALSIRFLTPSPPNKSMVVEEIQEIFGKLFFDCEKIQIQPIKQGFSGAIIFRVVPWYISKGQGESLVVKIGEIKAIKTEETNYKELVEGVIGGHRIPKAIKVAHTKSIAGILYTFVGLDSIRDFASFFQENSVQDIVSAIDNLFLRTCFPWQHERGHYKPGFDLKNFYLEHLRLYPKKLDSLLVEYMSSKSSILIENSEEKTLKLGNFQTINPFYYIRKADFHSNSFFSTIHGDLTGHNVMVDQHLNPWLIDFAATKEQGHILQDYASFENFIRLLMVNTPNNIDDLYQWEKSLFQNDLTVFSSLSSELDIKKFEKANRAIQQIRALAHQTKRYTNRAYLIALFFNAVRTATFLDLPRPIRDHAFLSAALIAERLLGGIP